METLLPRTEFMITMINILCQMWSWNWFSVTANRPHVQWLKCNIELRACFVVAIWYWILLCHIITLNSVVIKSASNICWCQFHYHITYPASIASPPHGNRRQTITWRVGCWIHLTYQCITLSPCEPSVPPVILRPQGGPPVSWTRLMLILESSVCYLKWHIHY